MAEPRKFIRRALSVAAGLGLVAILHEFGVKYAEQSGRYDNLPAKIEAAATWLAALAEPLWFKLCVTFLVGAASGTWIDLLLKNRDRYLNLIDKEELAKEAESVGRRIAVIAAQGAARQKIAWQDDTCAMMSAPPEQARILRRDRSTEAQAWTIERYGELHFEALSVVERASKCISLDESDLWHIGRLLSSSRDVSIMAAYMAKLGIQLRHEQPNKATTDIVIDEFRAHINSANHTLATALQPEIAERELQ